MTSIKAKFAHIMAFYLNINSCSKMLVATDLQ